MSEKRPFTFGNEVIEAQVKEIDRLTKLVQETRTECDGAKLRILSLEIQLQDTQADAARFEWWFSVDKTEEFVGAYITGIREGWSLTEWRAMIDKARSAK